MVEHIHGRVFKNKQATMKWVAKIVVDKLKVHPNLTHVEEHEHLRQEYGVHIYERKMFRAIKKAWCRNLPSDEGTKRPLVWANGESSIEGKHVESPPLLKKTFIMTRQLQRSTKTILKKYPE